LDYVVVLDLDIFVTVFSLFGQASVHTEHEVREVDLVPALLLEDALVIVEHLHFEVA
jgi:hypothetical protein